jgi:hypothetical protein
LVGPQPDIILTSNTQATVALQRETRTIPIVFTTVGDPVVTGIVARLNQPGGNITGFVNFEASRSFDRKHCPGAPFADRCQQAFKAWTTDARAGAAEIVVDDDYFLPSKLTRPVGQSVLTMTALVVVQQLISRRLTDIHEGTACQVL